MPALSRAPLITSMPSTAKLQVPGREMYLCRVLPKVEKQPWGRERREGALSCSRGHREPRGGVGCRGMWEVPSRGGQAEDFGSHWAVEAQPGNVLGFCPLCSAP